MWNTDPIGVTPAVATAGFNFHAPEISPWMTRPQNPVGDAVQQAIAAVAAIMQQRKNDKIANQLLAVDNAPKATAVNGMQPNEDRYAPDEQLTQAMKDVNARARLPSSDSGVVPDYGGVDALKAKMMFDQQQAALEDAKLGRMETRSKIWKNTHPGSGVSPYHQQNTDMTYYKNSPEYQQYLVDKKARESSVNAFNKDVGGTGLAFDDFPAIDPSGTKFVATKDLKVNGEIATVTQYDESGKPMSEPGKIYGTNPVKIPVKAGTVLTEQQAVELISKYPKSNKDPNPSGIVAQGTAGSKPFKIPLQDFYEYQNRAKAVPVAPVQPPMPTRGGASGPSGPPVGTKGTIKGVPVVWDGYGWTHQ